MLCVRSTAIGRIAIEGDGDFITHLHLPSTTALLDGFIETVKETLVKNESVQLIGFGAFEVTERAAREGRNPATGAALKIAAKKVVKFKPGKALAEAIAGE